MIGYQEIIVLMIVLAASGYLAVRIRNLWLRPKGGCGGGCESCAGTKETKPELLSLHSPPRQP